MKTVDITLQQHPLYRTQQIRSIEARAKEIQTQPSLMQKAAYAASLYITKLLTENQRRVLILAGAGDNGGDALELAALLAEQKFFVGIRYFGEKNLYSRDAQASLAHSRECASHQIRWLDQTSNIDLTQWDCLVDGLFGIGLNRPITGAIADLINDLNQQNQLAQLPVIALDIPSGFNADTGQIFGEEKTALRATHTLSFIADKPGLHTAKAKDFVGQISIASLDISNDFFPTPDCYLLNHATCKDLIPRRQHDSNKGSFGDVTIIGGNAGMVGAAFLAGRSALYAGAGRVHIGLLSKQGGNSFDVTHPELMCRAASQCDFNKGITVIGPGLGDTKESVQIIRLALRQAPALVIDADALNLIAKNLDLQTVLIQRASTTHSTLLTPHPLEAARLLKTNVVQIQNDRCQAALQLAKQFQVTVILKGAGSIIATPAGQHWINSSGNPSLATAGTGDILAGLCGALLAQGLPVLHAACLATFIHGAAADTLVKAGIGPIGLTASELIPAIRQQLNR